MRRRACLWSLSVAVLVMLFFLAWLASEPYEATAVVRVPRPPGASLSEHPALFERMQAAELTVINQALDSRIANCPSLLDETAKDLWIQKRLSVELVGDEFIRFTLRGDDPDDVAAILNAVTEAAIEQQRDADRDDLHGMRDFAEQEKLRLHLSVAELEDETEDSVERQLLQMEFERQAERVAELEDQVFRMEQAGHHGPQLIQSAAVPQESLLQRILRRLGL